MQEIKRADEVKAKSLQEYATKKCARTGDRMTKERLQGE